MEKKVLLPGWEIVRTIGSGGFGKVYEIRKAGEETGEYRSALKVISIPQSPEEYKNYLDDGYDDNSITAIFKSQVDDIVSEFQLMSQFRGISNIVSYEGHSIVPKEEGYGWDILIRMELLTTLPEHYQKLGGLSEREIIKLGMDVCKALVLCGKKNIIHRDIKPQNIFVNAFGDYKLGDFGIAKTMDHTTKATKIGTYSYMAPEVYRGQAYNASVDIYSLGLVLYWLLNERRLPFVPLPTQNAANLSAQGTDAQARRLSGEELPAPKNGSKGLKNTVLKACAFREEERFATPQAFMEALRDCERAMDNAGVYDGLKSKADDQEQRTDEEDTCGIWNAQGNGNGAQESTLSGDPTEGMWDSPGERDDPTRKGVKQPGVAAGAQDNKDENTCPWCAGKKREILVAKRAFGKYTAVKNVCLICKGTGTLKGVFEQEQIPYVKIQCAELRKTKEGQAAEKNCLCCEGKGWVHNYGMQYVPCPKCQGKDVDFFCQTDVAEQKEQKKALRWLSLACVIAYLPLAVALGALVLGVSGRAVIRNVDYLIVLGLVALASLPIVFALRNVRKVKKDGWLKIAAGRLVVLVILAVLMALLMLVVPMNG